MAGISFVNFGKISFADHPKGSAEVWNQMIHAGAAASCYIKLLPQENQVFPMKRYLVMTSGPEVGKVWPLTDKPILIGRHTDNTVQLKDLSVSRFHCEIRKQGDQWLLIDNGSRSGTFLNQGPVQSKPLVPGDGLEIGQSRFLFLDQPPQRWTAPSGIGIPDASTVTIHRDEVFDLLLRKRSEKAGETVAQGLLQMLLRLSEGLYQETGVEAMGREFLAQVLQVLPIDRAALVFHAAPETVAEILYATSQDDVSPFPLPELVTRMGDGKWGCLCHRPDAEQQTDGEPQTGSGEGFPIICVPVHGPYHYLGALFLEQLDRADLEGDDLALATAMARIAAPPLEKACHLAQLTVENQRLRGEALSHGMVGESKAMQKVYRFIQQVAATDTTILIRGESGTGKELAARAIYLNSNRCGKPFVAINCAVLSESLLNSELFGHERGAFTGAVSRKIGKLEVAQGGTLFLDEVGELPLSIQAKLLRVLQEREFERLGGNLTVKVDIRIIAATNRPLEQAMAEGRFREDLFYRLNVIAFSMPPLRKRGRDVLLLATWFAAKHARTLNKPVMGISSWAKACLSAYPWPGNVRELSNAIERSVVLGEDALIRVEDLPEQIRESQPAQDDGSPGNYQAALNARKKELIRHAVSQAEGNITRAAALLDLHPNYLHRLMRNLGMKSAPPKNAKARDKRDEWIGG